MGSIAILAILSLQIQKLSINSMFLSWMGPFQGGEKSLVIFSLALFLGELCLIFKKRFFFNFVDDRILEGAAFGRIDTHQIGELKSTILKL